jgi:hypothetical protein
MRREFPPAWRRTANGGGLAGKTTLLALIPCALLCSEPLRAQATDAARNEPEEVIVRGQRAADIRSAHEAARVRVYDVFNALNSDDAFDVHCQLEASTGTRMRQHICRPRFKDDISSAAAKAWVDGLKSACPGGMTQLASPELRQAILDYEAIERRYREARGGGRRARACDRPAPPPRCSR